MNDFLRLHQRQNEYDDLHNAEAKFALSRRGLPTCSSADYIDSRTPFFRQSREQTETGRNVYSLTPTIFRAFK